MYGRRSLATSIMGFALAVLVAAVALDWAADLLRAALPIVIPLGLMVITGIGVWRWYTRPRSW